MQTTANDEIKIRTATPEDAEALAAIYAPYVENTSITFEYTVPSVKEFAERIRHTLARYPYLGTSMLIPNCMISAIERNTVLS